MFWFDKVCIGKAQAFPEVSQVVSQKSSIVWCHYGNLTAPGRDGASLNSKHV